MQNLIVLGDSLSIADPNGSVAVVFSGATWNPFIESLSIHVVGVGSGSGGDVLIQLLDADNNVIRSDTMTFVDVETQTLRIDIFRPKLVSGGIAKVVSGNSSGAVNSLTVAVVAQIKRGGQELETITVMASDGQMTYNTLYNR